ncbi:MAG: cysteine--tRNA ligase [Chloroflexi bacterium]|nr:cysteine--tRNA ligase [Chloroflexota bacterium]
MKVTNTLTGRKEEFTPSDGAVKIYVCGITPYAPAHMGHAMSYIFFDAIRRYLEYRGLTVKHVQNFTDIDDKIIAEANRLGVPFHTLPERYIQDYLTEMDGLNIQRAHVYPRATQEIDHIVAIIARLIEKGYAYAVEGGDVYFRVAKAPGYGKLSHRSLESMQTGARVEANPLKEDPVDFALWKAAKPGEPAWDSPWSKGRPGWHIECTAMSMKYLGETLDIHGGGQDLIFPHHENELAQSECYSGKGPFARYWLHNGLLQLGEDKMSKSTGRLVTVREALERYSADAIRLFVLGSHYRSPLSYSEEAIAGAEKAVARLRAALGQRDEGQGQEAIDAEQYRRRFLDAMDDDFNTPQAVAALFDLARDINRARDNGQRADRGQARLRELSGVLGLRLTEPVQKDKAAEPFIEALVQLRQELRQSKQWALADTVRQRLLDLGVALEDTPKGTVWKHK